MVHLPNVAQIGALIGDPVRAGILGALMDGSERPAGELAHLSGVAPQTASAHLARLVDGGLLTVNCRGRHRFYRLSNAEVAHAIEALSIAADLVPSRKRHFDPELKHARRCYDHLAGELGVAICEAMIEHRRVVAGRDGYGLSPQGEDWVKEIGLVREAGSRRPIVRVCLDWSERRPHLAGWLGAELCSTLEHAGAVRRHAKGRALTVTPAARPLLRRFFGIDWAPTTANAAP